MTKARKVVILGGVGPLNIKWTETLRDNLTNTYGYDVTILRYEHWDTGKDIDFDKEVDNLKKILDSCSKTVVIAKSVGSLVAMQALYSMTTILEKLIIIGFPITYAEEKKIDYALWLSHLRPDTLCIQSKHDPMGSGAEVARVMLKRANVIAKIINGSDHRYNKIKQISNLIHNFVN